MLRGLFLAFLACLLGAAGVSAQSSVRDRFDWQPGQTGTIQGTVESAGGRPLSGISVKLQSMEAGFVRIGYTGENGHFAFADLPSGNYSIAIDALGFQPERHQVRLSSTPAVSLSFILKRNARTAQPEGEYTVSVRQLRIPEKAREEYRKGIEKLEQGKVDDAIKHWNKSIKLYPQYTESYLQLSKAYFDRKDLPKALEMAKNAVAVDQRNANALCILGYVYVQVKDYPKAKEAFIRSVQASNSEWLSHFWLAWLLLKEKKAADAYDHIVLANQLRPGVPEIHILLFNSLQDLGHIKEAVAELDYFLEHFPNNEMAGKVRRKRDSLRKTLAAGTH